MSRVRIAVVGVGAIGGAVAADLADLGRHEIVLCVRSAFDELRVRHSSGESRHRLEVVTDPAAVDPVDWVLLAVKAHQSEAARPWLQALARPGVPVVVLQNGVDHVERISLLLGDGGPVLPVVVQLPAVRTAPGRVDQLLDASLIVADDELGRDFAQLFEHARNRVVLVSDFLTQAWWKLMSNAAIGGVCTMVQRENRAAAEPVLRELVLDLMREVAMVGRAEGARLPFDAAERALGIVVEAAPDHWSSIAVDLREGRPMEWQVRNAVVGLLGRRHGIDTPLNDAITALLRAVDPDSD